MSLTLAPFLSHVSYDGKCCVRQFHADRVALVADETDVVDVIFDDRLDAVGGGSAPLKHICHHFSEWFADAETN